MTGRRGRGPIRRGLDPPARAPCPSNLDSMPHEGQVYRNRVLLDDLGDATGADGAATLTDGEPQALLHGDRLDQLDRHLGVVAGHDHLGALGQGHDAGDVGGAEVELRAVVVEERRVPATLVLGQDVDLRLELGVRGDRAGLHDDLAALDVLALGATKEQTDVLAGLALVEQLAEHLDAGDAWSWCSRP